MSKFLKQFVFVSLAIAILMIGGLVIYSATPSGNLKINPILGHDLDLNALYYASAGNNTVHDITTQDISVSAWVKWDTDGSGSGMVQSKRAGSVGYTFYLNSTNVVGFYMQNSVGGGFYGLLGNTNVRDNKWHYVSVIIDRDNATNCKLFLDGYEDGITNKTGAVTDVSSMTNTNTFTIGARADLASKLDGQIRDVKLYYAAGDHWSDAQVLYQAQHPFDYTANAGTLTDYWRLDEGSGTTLYGLVNNLTLSNALAWTTQPKIKMVKQENTTTTSNNPVGWWKMDEGTASSSFDSSGNGNTGTLTGGVQWAKGKLGKGLSFDGVNDYVAGGNLGTIFPITMEAWVKTTTSTPTTNVVDLRANDSIPHYALKAFAGNWAVWENGVGNNSGSAPIVVNTWTHLVAVISTNSNILYVNGVRIGSAVGASNWTQNNYTIGRYDYGASGYFNGLIDDVRIYNRALSAGEVGQMYNSTKDGYLGNIKVSTGLVGYWKLDDNNALTSVIDYSGKGNTGTAYSGTATSTSVLSTSTAMIGRAMSFDGSNDYIGQNTSNLSFTELTVSVWVKSLDNASAKFQGIVAQDNISGHEWGWFISKNSYYAIDNKFYFSVKQGTGNSPYTKNDITTYSNVAYTDNNWHHIVGVVKSNGSHYIYIDGVQQSAYGASGSNLNSYLGTIRPIVIGTAYSDIPLYASIGQRFNGLLDEVKIWNYARTAEDIKNDYAKGLANLQ